jgi:hypothetical protein
MYNPARTPISSEPNTQNPASDPESDHMYGTVRTNNYNLLLRHTDHLNI